MDNKEPMTWKKLFGKERINFRTFEMTEHETHLSYFFLFFFLTIGLI